VPIPSPGITAILHTVFSVTDPNLLYRSLSHVVRHDGILAYPTPAASVLLMNF
jgi:hypothetical protein